MMAMALSTVGSAGDVVTLANVSDPVWEAACSQGVDRTEVLHGFKLLPLPVLLNVNPAQGARAKSTVISALDCAHRGREGVKER